MKRFISVLIAAVFLLIPFQAFAEEYRYGYDVSVHNAVIDCAAASKNGKSFCMIRLGYSNQYVDDNFYANVKACVESHTDFGVYLYSYAYNEAEAKSEAEFVLKTLASIQDCSESFTLPVAYDLEEAKILQNAGRATINKMMTVFCDTIADAGYVPMVYANNYWFESILDTKLIAQKGYKTWYARYPSGTPDFASPIPIGNTGLYADMWQYKKGDASAGALDEDVVYYPSLLIKPLGCIHSYETTLTPATVGKAGNISAVCKLCGRCKAPTPIPAIASVKAAKTLTYTGKEQKPAITVKDAKGNTIPASAYSVSYADNKKVGTATATVTFTGNYRGRKKLTFKIVPKGTQLYKPTAGKKQIKVSWKKQKNQTTGYQLQYSTNASFKKGNKTKTVKGSSKTAATLKKLKSGKKYYVRIRTYKTVAGKNYYSAWSKAKAIRVK